jgi:hypothetical protein
MSTFPPAATAIPGRRDEAHGAHRAPIDGGGDPAVQRVCQLRGGEFVGTTVSGRPRAEVAHFRFVAGERALERASLTLHVMRGAPASRESLFDPVGAPTATGCDTVRALQPRQPPKPFQLRVAALRT